VLRNYFKIALRNLWKRKGYSFINIFGLSLSVAAAILITLYAMNQLTYDRFNKNASDIYMVYKQRITPTGTQDTYDTWVPLKNTMEQTYASVKNACRIYTKKVWVEKGTQKYQENITYTDPEFFDMFSFPLTKGDKNNPMPGLHSVVLSKSMAKKYFGNQNPIGKTLKLDYKQTYTVTGVMDKIPQNSSIHIDMAVPMKSASSYGKIKNDWGSSFLNTYIQLRKGTDPSAVAQQFPALITKIWDAKVAKRTNFKLLPLTEVNNRFNNTDRFAYILLCIALAILLIAGINFMNMATARSMERAREVGMRKALGGGRSQLITQFLGESVFIALLAVFLGVCLTEAALPFFNSYFNVQLGLFSTAHPLYPVVLFIFGILLGLLAGSYPAFYLSRFSSIETLRGKLKNRPGGSTLRKTLVVSQFAITLVILISVLIMRRQVRYMEQADLGFQQDNIMAIHINPRDFKDPKQASVHLETFKNEIAQNPDITSVCSSMTIPGQGYGSFVFAWPQGWTNSNPMRVRYAFIDNNFFDTYHIKVVHGRNFRKKSKADEKGSIIVNQAAVKAFGWKKAVGKTIGFGSKGQYKLKVIGVVKNYNYQSLQNSVKPVLHAFRTPDNGIHNYISVRLRAGNIPAAISFIKKEWTKMDAHMPMNYFFVDQNFNRLYRSQEQLISVTGIFSLLAIFIACMGLLGLVSLMVAQRTKEIGIRKVMGASVRRLVLLLSKDFLLLVGLGLLIAIPPTYYLMSDWLQHFAYRTDMPIASFITGGMTIILVALLIIGLRAYYAASINPVESIRDE
jgi:putative ABC transport system permease protein